MTKIEAFRQATFEIGDATSEEMSAYVENKFGIVIAAPYIPLFRATLRFQNGESRPEKPKGSLLLPRAGS
jgi:hypothetical protein